MSIALFAFIVAFVVLAQIESVTRIMIAAGLVLLVLIAFSGVLLGFVCDMFDPHGIGAYIGAPKQTSVAPRPVNLILAIAGGLAGMLTGPMAAVPAAIGAMFLVHDWGSNQHLAPYIRFTIVLTYLYSFLLGYFVGRFTRLVLAEARAGALITILFGVGIGVLIFTSTYQLLVNIIEPAQKSYICVFGW